VASTKADFIKVCTSFVGTTEHPPGSNHNAITEEFGFDGSWCDMKVSVAGKHAGAKDIIGWFAFTPSHALWFEKQGLFHRGSAGIQVGDIIFYAWYGPSYQGRWLGICHVGVVIGIKADGRLVVDEGNHNDADQIVVRSRSSIAGYGRPRYIPAPGTTTPIPATPHKPAPKAIPPTIRKGSHGGWVKILQKKLGGLVIDGDFGPRTDAHVRTFQRNRGLVVDGVVGPKTWGKLGY
jgi:hypothetical protein